jgi:putative component of membrane protein insertase Oxa1/YidC/SpoIIIJ protein YidD
MKKILLVMIATYQRFISPIKGYSCAYKKHTGRTSCSTFGYQAIERYGVWIGFLLLRRRFAVCSDVYRRHRDMKYYRTTLPGSAQAQLGFCDLSIDACTPADIGSCACDALGSCDSLPCDFGDWRRSRKMGEER